MKNDRQLKYFFIFACILLLISFDRCDADKNKHKHDKNKGKHGHQQQQTHNKNSTSHQPHNNTFPHNNSAPNNNNAPDIGWSLHNNPNQPAPAANPNGYALHHHEQGHGGQNHPGSPQQGHFNTHQQPGQQQPAQNSGPSALGAGMGGLALGAIGGAAGGYLLSNALNGDDKSGEADTTTLISETTAAALNDLPSTISSETSAIPAVETTPVVVQETIIATVQSVPSNVVSETQIEEKKLFDAQTVTTQESTTEKGSGVVFVISVKLLMLSLVMSLFRI